MIAAARMHPKIVELLVASGANVNMKCDWGSTPLHCAAGVSPDEPETDLLESEKIIILLFEHGAIMEARDDSDSTPLHWAIWRGNVITAKALLQLGADSNARSEREGTPLLVAVNYHRSFAIIELLLANGANPNFMDGYGNTPLNLALENYEFAQKNHDGPEKTARLEQLSEVVELLRAHGAKE